MIHGVEGLLLGMEKEMEPFDRSCCWDGLDHGLVSDAADFLNWSFASSSATNDVSSMGNASPEQGLKRTWEEQKKASNPTRSKACREKMRREKMNDMFSQINSVLHRPRSEKTDKSAILTEVICALNKLKAEAKELKEKKRKLEVDIKTLKAEKAELHEDKLRLKASKAKIEQQLNSTELGPGKLMGYTSYVRYPMWHWISPAVRNTSQDHVLRPPVA